MTDITKTISVVTTIQRCFTTLCDTQMTILKKPWYLRWRRELSPPIYLERNYVVAHRSQPFIAALVVPHGTSDIVKTWVKASVEKMLLNLNASRRPVMITTGRLAVLFEIETTPDGVVYGFLVQERVRLFTR